MLMDGANFIQLMERINKIDDMGFDNAKTDFTLAVKEICQEYDDKGIEKEDFMPEIDDGKSRSCIDESLKDSVEKVQFTKNEQHTPKTGEVKRRDEVVYVEEKEKSCVIDQFVT